MKQLLNSRYKMFTLPRLQSFNIVTGRKCLRCDLDSNLTLRQLFDSNIVRLDRGRYGGRVSIPTFRLTDIFELGNLTTIQFSTLIEEAMPEIFHFLSKIIALSPYLTSFMVYSHDSKKLTQHLTKLFRRNESKNILNLDLLTS